MSADARSYPKSPWEQTGEPHPRIACQASGAVSVAGYHPDQRSVPSCKHTCRHWKEYRYLLQACVCPSKDPGDLLLFPELSCPLTSRESAHQCQDLVLPFSTHHQGTCSCQPRNTTCHPVSTRYRELATQTPADHMTLSACYLELPGNAIPIARLLHGLHKHSHPCIQTPPSLHKRSAENQLCPLM